MKTQNLTLLPHVPNQLAALIESSHTYQRKSGRQVAQGVREFLLAASPDFLSALRLSNSPDPWKFGFAIVHTMEKIVIGMCGFAAAPGSDGFVEIAYSIAPSYQGKGYATEAASALVDFASKSDRVRTIRAHTLPEVNASTRILEKCGFRKVRTLTNSENNLVWRWERTPSSKGAGSTTTS